MPVVGEQILRPQRLLIQTLFCLAMFRGGLAGFGPRMDIVALEPGAVTHITLKIKAVEKVVERAKIRLKVKALVENKGRNRQGKIKVKSRAPSTTGGDVHMVINANSSIIPHAGSFHKADAPMEKIVSTLI